MHQELIEVVKRCVPDEKHVWSTQLLVFYFFPFPPPLHVPPGWLIPIYRLQGVWPTENSLLQHLCLLLAWFWKWQGWTSCFNQTQKGAKIFFSPGSLNSHLKAGEWIQEMSKQSKTKDCSLALRPRSRDMRYVLCAWVSPVPPCIFPVVINHEQFLITLFSLQSAWNHTWERWRLRRI